MAGDLNTLDAIEAVAAWLATVHAHRVEHDIASQCAAERVRLDPPDAAIIGEVNAQSVGPRESNKLEEGRSGYALAA